uniref:Essential protein Yae1 N-terminal domain-containing protein n=1 Tax=Amblyomma cajennense TaxID=34607 RepID=A0A023FPE8_AMBCJ
MGDGWESRVADVEWQRLQAARDQDGLRDGLAEGKERALQAGFDQGFREGFQLLRQVAVWRGLVQGACSFAEGGERAELSELANRLVQLERDLLAGRAAAPQVRQARAQVESALQARGLRLPDDEQTPQEQQ